MNRFPSAPAEFTEFVRVSPEDSAAWDPFLLQVVDETPLQARALFRDLALGVYLSGRHRIRRQIGPNVVEGWSDPVEDTLDQSIKLRELAALAGISARHFERAFRQSTGSSPHAYVMERRLRMGRDLLINQPELPIEHIRLRLGFSSSSHFSSAFRRRTGVTPKNFRKTWSQ